MLSRFFMRRFERIIGDAEQLKPFPRDSQPDALGLEVIALPNLLSQRGDVVKESSRYHRYGPATIHAPDPEQRDRAAQTFRRA